MSSIWEFLEFYMKPGGCRQGFIIRNNTGKLEGKFSCVRLHIKMITKGRFMLIEQSITSRISLYSNDTPLLKTRVVKQIKQFIRCCQGFQLN